MNNLNENGFHHFQTDAKPGEQGYCAPDGTDPQNPTELRMPSLSEVTKCQISFPYTCMLYVALLLDCHFTLASAEFDKLYYDFKGLGILQQDV